jgi:hypothetical protein
VRDYLPADAFVHQTNAEGSAGGAVACGDLAENAFYLFDADALNAFFCAIGEISLEEASGTLLATVQAPEDSEPWAECLAQLAGTLDRVELIGAGRQFQNVPRIKAIKDARGACKDFRGILYQGTRLQVMLLCRGFRSGTGDQPARFTGFYTSDSALIRLVHAELVDAAQGRAAALREFARLQSIDQAAKQLQREFVHEQEALGNAMHRLRMDPKRYQPDQFASDLEKGLSRLHEWKRRLPEIVNRAKSS